jgi:putative hydrolase of the HAD superfamily
MEAIIFDLDNTIVDRQKTLKSFLRELYSVHVSRNMTEEELIDFVLAEDHFGYRDKIELFEEIVRFTPWKTKMSFEQFKDHWYYHFPRHAQPMYRVHETLRELKFRKKKIGLITNGKVKTQMTKIKQLNIEDYFDSIVISEAVGTKKPQADIFNYAINDLTIRIENSVYVGDHPRNDIFGAKQIGMKTIWKRSYTQWDGSLDIKPDYCVEEIHEILDWLSEEEGNIR